MRGRNAQLFILGLLAQGSAHGYQIRARAMKWGVDEWAGFSTGSIYNSLGTLESHELICKQGVRKRGAYAPATVYAITELGRARLPELLFEAGTDVELQDSFDLVSAFLGVLSPEERPALLSKRVDLLQERMAVRDSFEHLGSERAQYDDHPWAIAALEKGERVLRAQLESCLGILASSGDWPPPRPLSDSESKRAESEDM